MKSINYSKQAMKFLKTQDKATQIRIIKAIKNIPNGNIKTLKGYGKGFYRLRVGDFRVIYNTEFVVIDVIKIGNRGDIYK